MFMVDEVLYDAEGNGYQVAGVFESPNQVRLTLDKGIPRQPRGHQVEGTAYEALPAVASGQVRLVPESAYDSSFRVRGSAPPDGTGAAGGAK